MGKGYLIDSNTIIDFFNGTLPLNIKNSLGNSIALISVITQIEIFSSNNISAAENLKLNEFINTAIIYNVDNLIALQTVKLRLKYKIKLPDAIIAATAIQHNLKLVTRNISDFNKIEGLILVNSHPV